MTKQTTKHDETNNRAWRNRQPSMAKQPGMTTHQSLPTATGNLINPTVTPTYPPVIPDLIGNLRTFGLAPSARRKDAKRMFREARKAGLL